MSNPGTNTTTSNNQPPQQFLDAYQHTYDQAKTTAGTPYTPYSGQMVAGMSPDQMSGITAVQNAQGAATPYINSAAQYIDQATQPIWDQVQHFSPGAVSQYQSPYTKSVVDATQAEFNNQNQQQQQGVIGNAISSGAWGGDRAGVAQGITAGQQALAQAPVIAGLNNAGYTQALNEFNTQQGSQLGATQANAWLNSQAGAAMGNLGQEALGTSLTGANALLGTGGLEQTQAQAELNVPYQQYTAQQAYPFQSTGWLANIAEGLGGASGGISSTTSPGPSVASQIGGGALAGAGILGQTGAYGSNGNPGWLSGLFSGSGGDIAGGAVGSGYYNRGGLVRRAPGGDIPNLSIAVVPGSVGLGASPLSHGPMDILKNYGDTSTTTQTGGDSGIGSILKAAGTIAAGIYGGPAGGLAASALSNQVHFSDGGGIMPFPIHRARAPGTGRGIVANDDWHPEPVQHRATGGGADMPTLGSSFFMLPSRHGGPSVPFMLSPSVNNIGGTQVGGGGSTTSGTGPASPIQAYFDKQNAGRSFTKPPGPVVPAVPPPAPAPALDGSTPNAGWDPTTPSMSPDQGGGQGGGNARGGIIARRDEGGDVPDDDGVPALDPTLRSGLTDLARLPTDLSGSAHIHRNESSGSMASSITGDAGDAAGPMQVHAGALADVNKTYGTHYTSRDMIDHPEIGRAVGNAYYEILKHQFGGDERLATAAYQAGPGTMRAALENGTGIGGLSPHTQDYVARAGFGAGQSPSSAGSPADEDQYSFATRSRPAGAGIMPSDAPVDTPSTTSPWRMLTNVGLGIMGGTSPQAGVNIGKGALTGIAQTDKENQTEAQQAMTREQQRSTNMFRTAQLTLDQAKLKQTGALTQQQRDIENARLAALTHQHEQSLVPPDVRTAEWLRTATPEQQESYAQLQARSRPFTYKETTQPDPDNPGKMISGVLKLDPRGVTLPEFIRTDTDPNKPGGGGMGSRAEVFFNRVVSAGNEAAAAARNIMELPTTASRGFFGGRSQGPSLFSAAKETLTNTLTSQEVQDYNSMIPGVARNLSTIEAAGLAPSGALTHSMDSLVLKEGDSELTKLRKMAELRQIVEKGLEPNLDNPKIPPEQKAGVRSIIKQMAEAIPFTHHDITMLQQSKTPGQTMADLMKAKGLSGQQSTPSGATTPQSSTTPQFVVGKTYTDAKGNKAIYQGGDKWTPAP